MDQLKKSEGAGQLAAAQLAAAQLTAPILPQPNLPRAQLTASPSYRSPTYPTYRRNFFCWKLPPLMNQPSPLLELPILSFFRPISKFQNFD